MTSYYLSRVITQILFCKWYKIGVITCLITRDSARAKIIQVCTFHFMTQTGTWPWVVSTSGFFSILCPFLYRWIYYLEFSCSRFYSNDVIVGLKGSNFSMGNGNSVRDEETMC